MSMLKTQRIAKKNRGDLNQMEGYTMSMDVRLFSIVKRLSPNGLESQ